MHTCTFKHGDLQIAIVYLRTRELGFGLIEKDITRIT